MKIQCYVNQGLHHHCNCLVVGCYEGEILQPWPMDELDQMLGGLIVQLDSLGEFNGKLNKTRLIYTLGKVPAERILLVGLGKRDELTRDRLRQAGGTAAQTVRSSGLKSFASILHIAGDSVDGGFEAVLEGFMLGSYSFTRYQRTAQDEVLLEEITILTADEVGSATCKALLDRSRIICDSVKLARDLVSLPANIGNPSYLSAEAQDIAEACGIPCTVMEQEEMERLGMHAVLAVAKGSRQAPKFIVLEHRPTSEGKTIVLVGKGVTFDSGGISLKPREGMEKMKNDMAGAATVIATMRAVSLLGLKLNVIGLIPAVENLPGGGAYKPGDVIIAMSGHSIEIVNTDAEGRLILCDALHFAQQYKPAALIDVATLTGACVVALGTEATGLMGNDPSLTSTVKAASEASGERVWELPLWDEYGELMKSDIADLKNAGGPNAGAISAGWFLRQFAGTTPWVHLDIAGTAWEEKGRPYVPKGATGVGVRLLVNLLCFEEARSNEKRRA